MGDMLQSRAVGVEQADLVSYSIQSNAYALIAASEHRGINGQQQGTYPFRSLMLSEALGRGRQFSLQKVRNLCSGV